MRPNKQAIDLCIIKWTAEHGELPEIADIENETGLQAVTIMRNPDKDFPDEKKISIIERTVLNAYKEHHGTKAVSDATGIGYYDVSNTLTRLKKKGIIKNPAPQKPKQEKHNNIWIEIIRDYRTGKDVNLIGARGYIEPQSGNIITAIVWKNKVSHRIMVKESDYKVIGRRV